MDMLDYASVMGRSQELVPDWAQQELQRRLGTLQTQNLALDNQYRQRQIAAADAETAQQAAFEGAMHDLGNNPTAGQLRQIGARFPKFSEGIKAAADGMEKQQRESVVRDLAQVHGALGAGRSDLARDILQRHIDADKAAGKPADAADEALVGMIDSGDPDQIKKAQGFVLASLSALDDKAAKALAPDTENHFATAGDGVIYDQRTGQVTREATYKPEWQYDSVNERWIQKPGTEGGGPTSSGGGAGGGSAGSARGDVTRLINSDAGGGYVPASVQTLGQFVSWGRSLNQRGAKSSSAGTYQINGTTMAEFGPKALGEGWRSAPFNADTQDRVGKAIFDWAKQQPNPASALKGRWVSLSTNQAQRLVQGSWEQARGTIAAGETGGGARASANAGGSGVGSYGGGVAGTPGVINVPSGNPRGGKDAPSGYRYTADGQSLEPIPGGPADQGRSGGGKALPDAITKRLEPKLEARDGLQRALGTFRDSYGGHNILGDATNSIQGLTGLGAEGQRDWWAQFRGIDNQIRNALFGASLTDGEKAAYNATTITPRMTSAEIKRNLRSRLQVVNKALARQRNVLDRSGYSSDSISALFGDAPAAASAGGGGFRILRVRPK